MSEARGFDPRATSKFSERDNALVRLFKEYPVLKTLLFSGGGALLGNAGVKIGNKLGLDINPSLGGWVGALAPLAIQALTGQDTFGNLNQKGYRSLFTPVSSLADLPNRRGFVVNNYAKQLGANRSKAQGLSDHELMYSDLRKDTPIYTTGSPEYAELDRAEAEARLESVYA